MTSQARPFLKSAGGKTQLLPTLLPLLLPELRSYHEPFLGGGAVFFALRAAGFIGPAFLSDTNETLIETYITVRDEVEDLIVLLKACTERNSEEFYYSVRQHVPVSSVQRAARFIYLNKTCFNGLHRVNRAGKFNVPWGKYKHPTICDEVNLRACSAALQGVSILYQDFRMMGDLITSGGTVYYDPPYVPLTKTANFTSYGKEGFGEEDLQALAQVFRRAAELGTRAVLSNADMPVVRELFAGYHITEVQARRSVSAKTKGRANVGEVIISNFETP